MISRNLCDRHQSRAFTRHEGGVEQHAQSVIGVGRQAHQGVSLNMRSLCIF